MISEDNKVQRSMSQLISQLSSCVGVHVLFMFAVKIEVGGVIL